jgi:hypothetical protein
MAYIYGSFANVKLSKLPLLFSLLLAGTCCLVGGAAAGDYDLELRTNPNPFLAGFRYGAPLNGYAKVMFRISSSGAASILVYDFEGSLVRTLVPQRTLSSGEHEIEWDGRDDRGDLVAPGPYVVVLELTIQGELYRDTFVAVAHR